MKIALITTVVFWCQCVVWAGEISTFRAYVDTDPCARLMIGPITPSRIECSQRTGKEDADLVLVQLNNNMVFGVNKQKLLKPLVGQLAEASGEVKAKSGSMKLENVKAIEAASIPAGDPDRRLLEENSQTKADPQTWEKVRHELAMMPYITTYDFISFSLSGVDVILTGWTVRPSNRNDAYNMAKRVPGVETVINNVEVLPVGRLDMEIRAATRAALQRQLSKYFWRTGSDIRIIVKNGQVVLLGTVINKADSDTAYIQTNTVRGVFKVINLLRVQSSAEK